MTELNKGFIGIIHFSNRISPSHVDKFPFKTIQYVQKDRFFPQKLSTFLFLIISVLEKGR